MEKEKSVSIIRENVVVSRQKNKPPHANLKFFNEKQNMEKFKKKYIQNVEQMINF